MLPFEQSVRTRAGSMAAPLRKTAGWAALALLLAASPASAQEGSSRYLTLIGVPLATGAPAGVGFVSLSGTTRRNPGTSDVDGSAALGFGLGDSNRVGVQLSAHITSLTDNFGDSGYLAVKLSHRLANAPQPTFVGLTVDHLVPWGDATLARTGVSVALTSFSNLTTAGGGRYPVIWSLGVGSKVRKIQTEPGIFAGVGVGLTPTLGASIAVNGDEVELGVAWRPAGSDRVAIAAAVSDALDRNDHRRITIAVSYAIPHLSGASR